MDSDIPPAPPGAGEAGRRLWVSVTEAFELEEFELRLLSEACRNADQLDQLDEIVRAEGVLGTDGRAHPALVEARHQRAALAKTLSALRLPSGDEGEGRPQRRVGPRGTYSVGGGPARLRRVR